MLRTRMQFRMQNAERKLQNDGRRAEEAGLLRAPDEVRSQMLEARSQKCGPAEEAEWRS